MNHPERSGQVSAESEDIMKSYTIKLAHGDYIATSEQEVREILENQNIFIEKGNPTSGYPIYSGEFGHLKYVALAYTFDEAIAVANHLLTGE